MITDKVHIGGDPGATSRDDMVAGIPMAVEVTSTNQGALKRFGHWVASNPFATASISAPVVAGFTIVLGGGMTFAKTLMSSLLKDTSTISLAIGGLSFSLIATLTVSTIKTLAEIKEEQKQFRVSEQKRTERAEQHHVEQSRALKATEDVIANLNDLTATLIPLVTKRGPQIEATPNTCETWQTAEGEDYIATFGQLRYDVRKQRGPDGAYRFDIDRSRIEKIQLKRYAVGGAGKVSIIVPAPKDGEAINDSILSHLLLFRMIEQVADELGVAIDLSKVRFGLVDGQISQASFFIGKRLVAGQLVPFVNTYTDFYHWLDIPMSMIDDLVHVSFDPAIVEAYRNTAHAIMDRSSIYSLDELEARFSAHLPPRPKPRAVRSPHLKTSIPTEFVAFNDHLSFPYQPR